MKLFKRLSIVLILTSLILLPAIPAEAQTSRNKKARTEKQAPGKKKSGTYAKKGSKNRSGKKTQTKSSAKKTTETSADVKKKHQATENEIRETKRKISENDRSIRTNLADLQKLGGEIESSQKQIADMSQQVNKLNTDISAIESEISSEEAKLSNLRQQYLATVKKMRLKRSANSSMAFIFSSGSFNEALRRIRYLKKLAAWRDRQTHEISASVEKLRKNRELLAGTKNEKSRTLAREQRVKNELLAQQSQKDALVVRLRADGAALNEHLRRKQSEANALKGQIASLIAREEAAAAERRRQQEAEERRRQQEAEEARQLAERKAREEEARKKELAMNTEKDKKKSEKESTKENRKKKDSSKEKKNTKKTESRPATEPSRNNSKDYAEARKRRPRGEAQKQSSPKQSEKETAAKKPAASGGGFESSRGSLPRPTSGSFKVTSKFGRNSVPGLPDVVYDNPGIDAEVSNGASAQAVFQGKVSGIYVLPGYNTVVIVNHGNYYTVYGNIASPAVKQGDNVKQGQSLGKLAYNDDEKRTSIHFEVWKNRTKLNPLDWIR